MPRIKLYIIIWYHMYVTSGALPKADNRRRSAGNILTAQRFETTGRLKQTMRNPA